MTKSNPVKVPYVEARFVGAKHRPTAIVLDLSMTTSAKGAALGVAMNRHSRTSPLDSYHYMVDSVETYRGVWDDRAAYGCPAGAINVLVCAQPKVRAGQWETAASKPVIFRTADLVARLCSEHKIRPRYIDDSDLDRWSRRRWRRRGGIIVRAPGAWPRDPFLKEVLSQLKEGR